MSQSNKPKQYRYIYRDSKTGKLVTEEYYLKHPATTEREKIEI